MLGAIEPQTRRAGTRTTRSVLVLEPAQSRLPVEPVLLTPGEHTVGSSETCSVVIPLQGIQPRHCEIEVRERTVTVRALDRRTWLNNGPFTEAKLRRGDRLVVGPVEFVVGEITTQDESPPAPPAPTAPLPAAPARPPEPVRAEWPRQGEATRRELQRESTNSAEARIDEAAALIEKLMADDGIPSGATEFATEVDTRSVDRKLSLLEDLLETVQTEAESVRKHSERQSATARAMEERERRIERFERECAERQRRLDSLESELSKRSSELNSALADSESGRKLLDERWSELEVRQRTLDDETLQLESRRRDADSIEERLRSMESHLATQGDEMTQAGARLVDSRREIEARHAEAEAAASELADRERALEERLRTLEEQSRELAALRQEHEARQSELESVRESLADERRSVAELAAQVAGQTDGFAAAQLDLESSRTLVEEKWSRLAAERKELEERVRALESRERETQCAEGRLKLERDWLAQERTKLESFAFRAEPNEDETRRLAEAQARLDTDRIALEAEKALLETTRTELAHVAATQESARAELTEWENRRRENEAAIESTKDELQRRQATVFQERDELERARETVRLEQAQFAEERAQIAAEREALTASQSELSHAHLENAAWFEQHTAEILELARQRSELGDERSRLAVERQRLAAEAAEFASREVTAAPNESTEADLHAREEALAARDAALQGREACLQEREAALALRASSLEEAESRALQFEAGLTTRDEEWRSRSEQFDSKSSELADRERELERRGAELDSQAAEIDDRVRAADARTSELEERAAVLESDRSRLREEQSARDMQRAEMDARSTKLEREVQELEAKRSELASRQSEIDAAQAQLEEERATLAASQAEVVAERQKLQDETEWLRQDQKHIDTLHVEIAADRQTLLREREELEALRSRLEGEAAPIRTTTTEHDVPAVEPGHSLFSESEEPSTAPEYEPFGVPAFGTPSTFATPAFPSAEFAPPQFEAPSFQAPSSDEHVADEHVADEPDAAPQPFDCPAFEIPDFTAAASAAFTPAFSAPFEPSDRTDEGLSQSSHAKGMPTTDDQIEDAFAEAAHGFGARRIQNSTTAEQVTPPISFGRLPSQLGLAARNHDDVRKPRMPSLVDKGWGEIDPARFTARRSAEHAELDDAPLHDGSTHDEVDTPSGGFGDAADTPTAAPEEGGDHRVQELRSRLAALFDIRKEAGSTSRDSEDDATRGAFGSGFRPSSRHDEFADDQTSGSTDESTEGDEQGIDLQGLLSSLKGTSSEEAPVEAPSRLDRSAEPEDAPPQRHVVVNDIDDSDSVAAYMQQLFARNRRTGGDAVPEPTLTAKTRAPAPEPERPRSRAVESIVVEAPSSEALQQAKANLEDPATPAPVPEPLHKPDRDAIRASIHSLRQVANLNARTALATHSGKQMKTTLQLKAAMAGVAIVLAVVMLVPGLLGTLNLKTPAWALIGVGLITVVELVVTLRQIRVTAISPAAEDPVARVEPEPDHSQGLASRLPEDETTSV